MTPTYGPLRTDGAELDAVVRALTLAFGGPESGVREWLDSTGTGHVRVLRGDGGEFLANLLDIPMGQYFGGRSVPMSGIAGVATPPELRGRGHALTLMRECVRATAEAGTPLSCLYASTQALYRQAGYEQAGHYFVTRIPIATLGVRDRSLAVRELTHADERDVRAVYARYAAPHNGMLDRGDYCWKRTRKMRDTEFRGFGVFGEGDNPALEGYLFMSQRRDPASGRHDVAISDIAWRTPRAARRLLGLIADFGSMGLNAEMVGPAVHPLCTLLPQQKFTSTFKDLWMVRVCLLREAIESRGYLSRFDSFALEITDDIVEQNAGRWTVSIEGGRARAERGGQGPAIRCDIRGFVPVYTGLYSASQAAALGLIEGDDEAIAAADAAFAGPTPWMADPF